RKKSDFLREIKPSIANSEAFYFWCFWDARFQVTLESVVFDGAI
ncbi:unnamed protein product, partial [Callosobruchus maculatus]